MIVIGITGTIGAGKGTVVDFLLSEHHFAHYSVRGFLIEEATRRGMPLNRDTYVAIANELRANHSPSYIVDTLFEQAAKSGKNAIIESIRTPGEVASLRKNKDFALLAIDADPQIRYKRITLRNSETDQISYETFLANEAREMHSTDPNQQNLAACMEQANYNFSNNGSMEELFAKVNEVMSPLMCNR